MTKSPWIVRVGIAGAVLLIAGRWWLHQRTTSNPTTGGQMVVGVLVAALLSIAIVVGLRRLGTRLVAGVRAVRPGAEVVAAWADASLGHELASMGVDEQLRAGGGTHLALVWDGRGIELWRDSRAPRPVVGVVWDQVTNVSLGEGTVAATPRPAAVVEVADGPRIVVVPARNGDGGVLPASADQARALVDALGAHARAARGASTDTRAC